MLCVLVSKALDCNGGELDKVIDVKRKNGVTGYKSVEFPPENSGHKPETDNLLGKQYWQHPVRQFFSKYAPLDHFRNIRFYRNKK